MKKGTYVHTLNNKMLIETEDGRYSFEVEKKNLDFMIGEMEEGGYEVIKKPLANPELEGIEKAIRIYDFRKKGLEFPNTTIELIEGYYIVTIKESGNEFSFNKEYFESALSTVLLLEA